jgi:RHS repeat-associated protein
MLFFDLYMIYAFHFIRNRTGHCAFVYQRAPVVILSALLLMCFPRKMDAGAQENSPIAHIILANVTSASSTPAVKVNHTLPQVTPPSSTFSLPNPATTASLENARLFPEPLVPVGGTPTAADNAALAAALTSYAPSRDITVLETYVGANAGSPWLVSVLTNLGLLEFHDGYFSKALADWTQAWNLGKSFTAPGAQAIVNRAVAELLRLDGRVGRVADVKSLLAQIKNRTFHGMTGTMIRESKEVLVDLVLLPKNSYKCGPFALMNILDFLHQQTPATTTAIRSYVTTPQGTSLAQVSTLAAQVGLKMQVAKRVSGTELPLPAVVNWKLNHYGALLKADGDRYLLVDPTFGTSEWILKDAVTQEASGYFLIPTGALPPGWTAVSTKEAAMVWGRGTTPNKDGTCTGDNNDGSDCNPPLPPPPAGVGMASWHFHTMLASLNITDTPLFYTPPVGPGVNFSVNYDHLEENQPATINYSNLGPLWNFSWLSSITFDQAQFDHPTYAYLATGGGGTEVYTASSSSPLTFYPEPKTKATLVMISATDYERRAVDGSKEVFNLADSSGRIYLTQMVDRQGNAVTMTYDSNYRLVALTDAIGQVSTLTYGSNTVGAALFYNITKVTDPFGRSASFAYNSSGQLIQITDEIGMVSQFAYGANDFIQTLTTPYGATNFTYTTSSNVANGNISSLLATGPGGAQERLDTLEISTTTPDSDPQTSVPTGMPCTNLYLSDRNSYFWDRKAMHDAPGDYSQAFVTHFLHLSSTVESGIVESTKAPLENRVWYFYQNQDLSIYVYNGMLANPIDIGRVLDDGTTQLYRATYNSQGLPTQTIDPLGRTTNLSYALNNIDVLSVQRVNGSGSDQLSAYTWNSQHCPLTMTDASGQTSSLTYNPQGQLTSFTDAKNETTTVNYNSQNYLTSTVGTLGGSIDTDTYTYDADGRVQTIADGEGYTFTYTYDALNRLLSVTYPDGTTAQATYTKLDMTQFIDRLGRATNFVYNNLDQLVSITDPLHRVTQYIRCTCGEMLRLIDPLGQTTSWTYDIESRPISKTYADGSISTLVYENSTSRLKTVIDGKNQQKAYSYNADNSLSGISYSSAQQSTPNVTYTYDPSYLRLASMTDGIGTTTYAYNPVTGGVSLGADQLAQSNGPWKNSQIAYTYDQLGRVLSRTINGVAETFSYDVLGRVPTVTNALGTFNYTYQDATNRILTYTQPNGEATRYSYFGNTGDWRLQQIKNLNINSSNLSEFDYTYNSVSNILTWNQQADANAGISSSLTYDTADQLTASNATGNAYGYTYDVAGNRLTQAVNGTSSTATYNPVNEIQQVSPVLGNDKTYTWDAEDRLVGINYVGTNRSTQLSYDGEGRCAQIVEKTGATVASTKRFVWCSDERCEVHDANDNVTGRYFVQGEQINGTPYFYTRDHLGSIREMTDMAGTLHARYSYDPYGTRTKVSGDLDATPGFTGLYTHAPSGLQMAVFRAYDSATGRWLNRDPIREGGGINLYAYGTNNPLNGTDLSGLDFWEWSGTFQIGGNYGGTFGGGYGAGGGLIIDRNGITPYRSDGPLVGSPGGGGGFQVITTNAPTARDLAGPSATGSFGGGIAGPFGGTADGVVGKDHCGKLYSGGGVTGGLFFPGLGGSGGISNTHLGKRLVTFPWANPPPDTAPSPPSAPTPVPAPPPAIPSPGNTQGTGGNNPSDGLNLFAPSLPP